MNDVKALAGTPNQAAIKAWANPRKLTLDAFEADPAWRGEVCNWLDDAKNTAAAAGGAEGGEL